MRSAVDLARARHAGDEQEAPRGDFSFAIRRWLEAHFDLDRRGRLERGDRRDRHVDPGHAGGYARSGMRAHRRVEVDQQADLGLGRMGHFDDADAADFDLAAIVGRRRAHEATVASAHLGIIVAHQHRAAVDQPEREIGLARARRPASSTARPPIATQVA